MKKKLLAGFAAIALAIACLSSAYPQSFSASGNGVSVLQAQGNNGTPNVFTPNAGSVGGGTASQFQEILWVPVANAANISKVIFEYGNYYNASGPQTVDPGPSVMTIRAGIWQPSISNRAQVTWTLSGGGIDDVLQPGQRDYSIPLSITIPPSDGGFYVIIWVRYASVPAAWPVSSVNLSHTGDSIQFGTALTDMTLGPQFFGAGNGRAFLPPLNVYSLSSTPNKSVIIYGDSISSLGNNDTQVGDWIGWSQRSFGPNYPVANIGASGMANFSIWQNADERMRHLGPYIEHPLTWTHFLGAMGTNDLKNATGLTPAQLLTQFQGNYNSLNAVLKPMGLKLVLATIPPLTDPTDTTENASYPGSWAQRTSLNTWIRTNPYGNGVFDISAQVEDPNNANLWRTDLGPLPSDGSHPPAPYHTVIVNYIIPLLPSIIN